MNWVHTRYCIDFLVNHINTHDSVIIIIIFIISSTSLTGFDTRVWEMFIQMQSVDTINKPTPTELGNKPGFHSIYTVASRLVIL